MGVTSKRLMLISESEEQLELSKVDEAAVAGSSGEDMIFMWF